MGKLEEAKSAAEKGMALVTKVDLKEADAQTKNATSHCLFARFDEFDRQGAKSLREQRWGRDQIRGKQAQKYEHYILALAWRSLEDYRARGSENSLGEEGDQETFR